MEWPEPWSRLAACGWTTARLRPAEEGPSRAPGEGVRARSHGGGAGGVLPEGQGVRKHRQDPVGGGRPVRRVGLGGGWLQAGQDLPAGDGGGGRLWILRRRLAGRAKLPWHAGPAGSAGWWGELETTWTCEIGPRDWRGRGGR